MKNYKFLFTIILFVHFIACKKDSQQFEKLPIVNTNDLSEITSNSAKCGGTISFDGSGEIVVKGLCWSTSSNPTILDKKTIEKKSTSKFESIITGLSQKTQYHVRAYATNNYETAYGNEVTFETLAIDSFSIGATYKGGQIAYIFQPEDNGYVFNEIHGIIVAPFDQATNVVWGCWNDSIYGTNLTSIGSGNQNTLNIINSCPSFNIAARLCSNLDINGYSDWFLPSKNELSKLCENRFIIGNFESNFYWSSSDDNSKTNAWCQSFGSGSIYFDYKTNLYFVRAIRLF